MAEILEWSPNKRFSTNRVRAGSQLRRYIAYDLVDGSEVVWSTLALASLSIERQKQCLARLHRLKALSHAQLVQCKSMWIDAAGSLNLITDCSSSRPLRSYLKKLPPPNLKLLKKWCGQLLQGLKFLHCQDPPMFVGNLSLDTVFINPTTGDLAIGPFLQFEEFSNSCESAAKEDLTALGWVVYDLSTAGRHKVSERTLAAVGPPQVRELIEQCLDPAVETPGAVLAHEFLVKNEGESKEC